MLYLTSFTFLFVPLKKFLAHTLENDIDLSIATRTPILSCCLEQKTNIFLYVQLVKHVSTRIKRDKYKHTHVQNQTHIILKFLSFYIPGNHYYCHNAKSKLVYFCTDTLHFTYHYYYDVQTNFFRKVTTSMLLVEKSLKNIGQKVVSFWNHLLKLIVSLKKLFQMNSIPYFLIILH